MDDEPFLAHAIVRGLPEESTARSLGVELGEALPKRPLVNAWRVEREGRELALVLLEARVSDDERRRFLHAAGLMRDLCRTQSGLLNVYEVLANPSAFLADLAPGGTLEKLATLAWPPTRRLDLVRRVATAMAELHEAGVVHGSLCPANVHLDKESLPALAEVGLVSLGESFDGDGEGIFGYGDYAAPEVKSGGKPDARSDVYSIGRLFLYTTIEDSPAAQDALARAARAQPAWVDVIRRATAESPESRFATAREFLTALDPLFDQVSVVEPEPPPPAPKPEPEVRPGAPDRKAAPTLAFSPPRPSTPPRGNPTAALVGALMIAAALAFAFLVGAESSGARAFLSGVVAVGAALASFALTPLPRWPIASRWTLAAGIVVVVFAYDPALLVGKLGAVRRLRGDATARRAAVQQLLSKQRDLRGAPLTDLDLSGLDMRGADLRGADLSKADLSQANLWGALVDGAILTGSHLEGAELTGTSLVGAVGLATTDCDAATRFPRGWRCVDGHPAPATADERP